MSTKDDGGRRLRATDFPETFAKRHPTCGHSTHNLKEPPHYCFHCDAEWTPVEAARAERKDHEQG